MRAVSQGSSEAAPNAASPSHGSRMGSLNKPRMSSMAAKRCTVHRRTTRSCSVSELMAAGGTESKPLLHTAVAPSRDWFISGYTTPPPIPWIFTVKLALPSTVSFPAMIRIICFARSTSASFKSSLLSSRCYTCLEAGHQWCNNRSRGRVQHLHGE